MIRILLAVLALLFAVPQAMAQDAAGARTAIEAALTDSGAGWNAGDLDRFLAVYSDDPATSFTGSKGIERGKAGIRARYLANYAGQFGSEPGTRLSFDVRDFRMIGADHALLIARWTLMSASGKDLPQTGMTSLLFAREAGGWKIIADHSS